MYKAIDEAFGCTVAIKETREKVAHHHKLRRAFEREAKLLRNLKHDSLPRVTDYFFQNRAQYLVMDFIEGEDLAAMLRKRLSQHLGPFTFHELQPWADKILAALEYLHDRPEPIIHRDIKPSNIKLADDGGIYLLDFGLAKGVAGQMSTIIEGQSLFSIAGGTPEYAPLEQFQGTDTQPQSDIYALGATLYHLLTGQLPISARQRDEAIQRGMGDPLRPAHEIHPDIPLVVSQVILRALAVRWWDRISSAKEMRGALASACEKMAAVQLGLDSQGALPDSKDRLDAPQPPQQPLPSAANKLEPASSHAQKSTSVSLHRSWMIVGITLLLIVGLTVAVLLAFPRWFPQKVSGRPDTQVTQPQGNLKPPIIITPAGLKPKALPNGHNDTVWWVTFSADGSLAASASEDGTIILWDTKTWEPKFRPLKAHVGAVYSVAFSPDGKTLVSGGRDKVIRLWDIQTGKLLNPLPQELTKPVLRLVFSPDGNILASNSGEPETGGEIRLWYPRNNWESKPLEGQVGKVFAIAFSPDSSTLATAGYGKSLRLWNLRIVEQSVDLKVNQSLKDFITTIAFSADGKYLACGGSDKIIKVWLYQAQSNNWEESQTPFKKEHKDFITSIAFSPDNKTLASASVDNTLRLWNVETGHSRLLVNPGEILASQRSVAFSPDGQTLITGGKDKKVWVWQ